MGPCQFANWVDHGQTAPKEADWSGLSLFAEVWSYFYHVMGYFYHVMG